MRDSQSPLMCVLSFAVVMAVTAARPAVATAQSVGSTIEALAHPDARIAFGVRRGAIQHISAKSPFAEVYDAGSDPAELVTLVTVHRFGQRAGSRVRIVPKEAPLTLRLGPSEEPLHIGGHPPIVWNLSERVRIAFGGRTRAVPMTDTGIERATAPIGSLTVEFGDRK